MALSVRRVWKQTGVSVTAALWSSYEALWVSNTVSLVPKELFLNFEIKGAFPLSSPKTQKDVFCLLAWSLSTGVSE